MKFRADHSFHIGSQHLRSGLPCQDYALSGGAGGMSFAVLSDGCSSGGMTDVGARIVALGMARTLSNCERWPSEVDTKRDHAAAQILGLTTDDLLATCASVAASKDMSSIYIRIVGDGVFAKKTNDGRLVMTRFEWRGNMPVYGAYQLNHYRAFKAAHAAMGTDDPMRLIRHWRGGHLDRRDRVDTTSMDDAIRGLSHVGHFIDSIDSIAVFSDGVTQVDGMDWRDVVAELMAFKSTEGEFVKRRMNRFLKDCLKHGKGPVDDISMAAIHIDHEAD